MFSLPLADSEERECLVAETVEQVELFCTVLVTEEPVWWNKVDLSAGFVSLATMVDKYDSRLVRYAVVEACW